MIHHFSFAAQNPYHVAQVLAELVQGQTVPFPPHPGSYITVIFDGYGTAIEVYPLGSELTPGQDEDQLNFVKTPNYTKFVETHIALSVTTTQEKIEAIAKREGWRAVRCNRDSFFDVIEVWVENRFLIELLTPEMARQYLRFTSKPENLEIFEQQPELVAV